MLRSLGETLQTSHDAQQPVASEQISIVKRSLTSLFAVSTALAAVYILGGCGSEPTKPSAAPAATQEKIPSAPAIPEEYQETARTMLGSDVEVLLYGDLAKTGTEQVLAANVVPNTPKSVVAGTVVTRAVVAEKANGKWSEVLRADEHLKNAKGFLGLTPLQAVTGWKLQYEQSPEKGLTLYFTPVAKESNARTLPIAVSWNPKAKRYQSMDPSYQHYLTEASTLENPRSSLR
jgi:hypothetical protein